MSALAAGASHTLALLENGNVMAWGANNTGELGNGEQYDRYYPVAVPGLSGVRSIGAGDGDSAALLGDGTVETWGGNWHGELGIGTDSGPETCSINAPTFRARRAPSQSPAWPRSRRWPPAGRTRSRCSKTAP